jgi:hypothetical protein
MNEMVAEAGKVQSEVVVYLDKVQVDKLLGGRGGGGMRS